MTSWINIHSHTNYCDGASAPADYIREAINLRHPAYGFSSHAPLPFPTDWNVADKELPNYIKDVLALKQRHQKEIEVYLGLEVDYIPGIAGRHRHVLTGIELDYFIGSVHFVDRFDNGEHWNIDTSAELFAKGLNEIFHRDGKRAATRFWEISREMIEADKPHVIGHLDKIKMFNTGNKYFNEQDAWYRDQVELTLDLIKKLNCIVEINTRGFYRYGQEDLYPGAWIIQKIARLNIPVMINSDAHHPSEISEGMAYTAAKLKGLGIGKLTALYQGKWNSFDYSEEGIAFS